MRPRFSKFYILLVLLMGFLAVPFLTEAIDPPDAHPFTDQRSFNLDFSDKTFDYEQRELNETGYPASYIYTYHEESNNTFWIELPRNSTVSSSSVNLTGLILVNSTYIGNMDLKDVSTGNVTSNPGNEIGICSIISGTENNFILYTSDEEFIWGFDAGDMVYDSEIHNLTSDQGNEIIIGSNTGVYVINSTGNFTESNMVGYVRSLHAGNITSDQGDEIVAGGDNLYLFNSTLDLLRNSSSITGVEGVYVDDATSANPGNEIAVGCGGTGNNVVMLLNYNGSSFNTIWSNSSMGGTVYDVEIGNISADAGKEIVAVSADYKVYAFASDGSPLWKYDLNDYGRSVEIGEVVDISPGNEVVVGTGGDDVINELIILNSTGGLILSYSVSDYVQGVAIGNITPDTGNNVNEILGVTGTGNSGYFYKTSYDDFPTDMNFTVNETLVWEKPGKFRDSQVLTNLTSPLQNFLGNCTSEICVVPFRAYSSHKGRLQVSDINISYSYNASADIRNQTVSPAWAKTRNIRVNQSIVNEAINVSYTEPALNITIKYMKINNDAVSCGFKDKAYSNATVSGGNYCNVTDENITIVPGESPYAYHLLWNDQMAKGIPVIMNEGNPYNTTGTDNVFWMKDITIWSNTSQQEFFNITSNTTIDDTIVKGNVFLNVTWSGSEYNITPDTQCPTMGDVGNGFYACYNDTNSNSVPDFFNWTQPNASAGSSVVYQAGGTRNLVPNITFTGVTPATGLWGQYFNFTATVEDDETDEVNVTLWVYSNFTGSWIRENTETVSGSGNATFNVSANKIWVGTGFYKFEYFDFNASNTSQIYHSARNTTNPNNFTVQAHNVSQEHVQGNNTNVSREYGTTSVSLMVYMNDSTDYANWTSETCTFRTTLDGSTWDWGNSAYTNTSGYCNHSFNPNGSYSVGLQTWNVSLNESFYNTTNPQNYTIRIKGHLNVSLNEPVAYQNVIRNQSISFEARLVDEYNNTVDSSSVNTSLYNCSWYFNNTYLNTTPVNTSGYCAYSWTPNCTYQTLGPYIVNVTLGGSDSLNYTILGNRSDQIVELVDEPRITIISPPSGESFYRGETIGLNATINDTCDTCDLNAYQFRWYMDFKDYVAVDINETAGKNRTNMPVMVTGQELQDSGANLTSWSSNSTKVTCGATDVTVQVLSSGQNLDTESNITFLVNLTENENKTCHVFNNDTLQNATLGYVRNSGFESGGLGYWAYTNKSYLDGSLQACSIVNQSDGENYSAYLFAYGDTNYLNQSLGNELGSDYIYLKYKAWGTYNDTSFVKVYAGGGSCNLNLSHYLVPNTSATWNYTLCYNESFSSATDLSITVKDYNTGGYEVEASHIYIDYLCPSDSSGNCVSYDSGAPYSRSLTGRENISSLLANSTESSWQVPAAKRVGPYTVFANLSGGYYLSRENESYISIFGLANVSYFNATSVTPGECIGSSCFTGVDINLTCRALDKNTSQGVYNFTVNFYDNGSYINSSQTDENGYAEYVWVNSTGTDGLHIIKCNISDSPDLYYNVTEENEMNVSLIFESSVTNGTLNVTPLYDIAENLTKQNNDTGVFNITVNNIGSGVMYGIKVVSYNATGIEGFSNVCTYLSGGENCTGNITFTTSRLAELGNNTVNVSLIWANPDENGTGFENKSVVINVTNTTVLNLVEDSVNYTIPYGATLYSSFTAEDFGNTGLGNVTFELSGGNASLIENWIALNGTDINQTGLNITRLGQSLVNMSVSVPSNQSYMGNSYWAYLLSEENSACSGIYDNCSDSLMINITVTQQHWSIDPLTDSQRIVGLSSNTVGNYTIVNITNYKTFNLTVNITRESNGSEFFNITLNNSGSVIPLPSSPFNVEPLSSAYLNVTYNVTGAESSDAGTYYLNISTENQNSSAIPAWINITRSLMISDFEIVLISPTQSVPVTSVSDGDNVEIHANATLGEGQELTENVTWTAWIGGEECAVTNSTNVTGMSYGWVINCTAPEIPGNPINNTLILSGNYTTLPIDFNDTETKAVIYDDIRAPRIWDIEIVPQGYSTPGEADGGDENVHYVIEEGNLTVRVNLTENNGTPSTRWINITGPAGQKTGNLTQSGSYWTYVYNISKWNTSIVGDYEVIVHLRDPAGNYNSSLNYTMRYFDIYMPMQFYSNFTYPDGTPMDVELSFYKPGTAWKLHENSSSEMNLSVHKRSYDIKAKLFNQEAKFLSVDLNQTALNQFNDTGAGNVTDCIKFDYFANDTADDVGNIELPDTAWKQYRLLGIVVEPENLSFQSTDFTLNYTEAMAESTHQYTEGNLEAFVCADWNYYLRTCNGDFTHFNTSLGPYNLTTNLFKFSTAPSSAYVLAESCYPNNCGVDVTTTVSPGGGGGSSDKEKEEEEGGPVSFEVDTNLGSVTITQGETKEYWLYITNKLQKQIKPKISITGSIKDYLSFSKMLLSLGAEESERVEATVSVPESTKEGYYTGTIVVEAEGEKEVIPVSIKVVASADSLISLEVDIVKNRIEIEEPLKFQVKLRNLGTQKELKLTLTYLIKDGETDDTVREEKENVTLEKMLSFTKRIDLNSTGLEDGEHLLEVWAETDGRAVNDMETFEIVKPFLATTLGVTLVYTLLILSIIIATIFIRKYYLSWKLGKEAKRRYIFPVNMNKIPQKTEKSFWIGTLAGSRIKAWMDPNDLTTHALVAGATGAGKSVGASVIIEEALEQKIPIIVFDPTAQWTGFVRGCRDENLLKHYSKFGMDVNSVRPYKGMIFEMSDPKQKIEFKEFMNPGEITVFTLNGLKPEEFDEAVRNIINSMFRINWEESTTLRMIVVFDEVHRLLEKYGGKGGYVALEKACREFRKWGIGLIMCSQVLADFKEAVSGNVLTDVQLNTKSLEDIKKARDKYGEMYAKRITRQGLGVGMIHNPKYNDGKPYFVQFRPTYHNPHKITNEELDEYREFAKELKEMKKKIEDMEKAGKETFDVKLELKLAQDKLKLGNFRMAKIYITSLKKHLTGGA